MNDLLESIPQAWKDRIIFLLVGAVFGTWSAGQLGVFRPDKFTGKMGRELKSELLQEINDAKLACARKDAANDIRITKIENRDEHIHEGLDNLARIVEIHHTESEEWKRKIESNGQWIQYMRSTLNLENGR